MDSIGLALPFAIILHPVHLTATLREWVEVGLNRMPLSRHGVQWMTREFRCEGF